MRLKNKYLFKLIILSSSIFFLNGCVSKNEKGTYASTYSYHPYNQSHFQNTQPRHNVQNPINQNIEQTAKAMLGTGYKYGANGPYLYDCSSFTKYVFSRQGIKIPRVSRDQAKVGQFIRKNQLQKGDLIFFDSKKSSIVSHVGIYLNNEQFIHASSSKKRVTVSSLTSKYYKEHFKWGRRVTNKSYTRK